MSESHVLIESGCLRRFVTHVLGATNTDSTSNADIKIHHLDTPGTHQAIKAIQKIDTYKQITKILETHGGDCPTVSQCVLGVRVSIDHRVWEVIVFETVYPPIGEVYLIFSRLIDCETRTVAAVIDPASTGVGTHNTVTAVEINSERVKPIAIILDQQLPKPDSTHRESRSQSPRIEDQIAIDWFMS